MQGLDSPVKTRSNEGVAMRIKLKITAIFLLLAMMLPTITYGSNAAKVGEYSVTDVVKKVSPSVVGIIGKAKTGDTVIDSSADGLLFGTGVIIKPNGYIITNAHVVRNMEKIVVVLSNSRAYQARLKALDNMYDLALIKIDKGMLPAATFGDMGSVEVGETVVAIGTPLSFSLRNSATMGIISGINRSVDSEFRLIQSDVAINKGNSGGPLVNMKGEVIGITSTKYMGYGIEGMSFSIPIDTVQYVISHFEKYGKVMRPWLGVRMSESLLATYGLPTDEGLTINEVVPGSPAEKAGLMEDDRILEVDGVSVNTIIDYNECMKKYLPGDTAQFTIMRAGNIIKVSVVFSQVP